MTDTTTATTSFSTMTLTTKLYDVLIIGSGPAGLASALGLSRVIRPCVVFDTGVFRNAPSNHMHTMPTWEHRPASEFRAAAKKEIMERYDTVTFAGSGVESILRDEASKTFEVTDGKGRKWKGKKVVIASGSRDQLLDIRGYKDAWGKGMYVLSHGHPSQLPSLFIVHAILRDRTIMHFI